MRLEVHNFKSLEDAKTWGRNQIDVSAGKARAKYLTVAEGQEATYSAKYADAKNFMMSSEFVQQNHVDWFPWVAAEAVATGVSMVACATRIKDQGDPWNFVIGPAIEALRISGKDNLDPLLTYGAIVSHVRTVQGQLNEI